ncbi:MAG TPA: amidohydrolase family protein [Burkholderiales bacterium]|nr:amidohydrolase family protein [Burkholderiales bacterium]
MIAEPLPSYHPAPSRPRLRLPALACDAHAHVLGPRARFPFAKGRSFTPADAPKERLFALHEKLGIARGIVVQSACHGFDNFVTTDAIAAKGGAYRGVAIVPADVATNELRRLDALGFCGARFNFVPHLGAAPALDKVAALAGRLASLGWHLRVNVPSALIEEVGAKLKHSPVPVVIEHMGRIDASLGLEQPAFGALRRLMENERFWVEVSGAVPFARLLVAQFGNRVLWGTGWPHQDVETPPDDGRLVDLLGEIAPCEAQLHALLVKNPQRLFRFDAPVRRRR